MAPIVRFVVTYGHPLIEGDLQIALYAVIVMHAGGPHDSFVIPIITVQLLQFSFK